MVIAEVGSSFRWDERLERFVIDIPSNVLKTKKSCFLVIPSELTNFYNTYLRKYRKHLPADNKALWPSYSGRGHRSTLSDLVKRATFEAIGVSISAHRFRAAVATMFDRDANSNPAEMRALARTMNQSEAVQRAYYVRSERAADAIHMNSRIRELTHGSRPKQMRKKRGSGRKRKRGKRARLI